MKKNFFAIFCFVCCAIVTQLCTQRVWAQTASAGITLDQAKAVKAIKVGNLDKDTYFKSGGFILDRYEERPAYVFTYSDGITRKIYLYKIFSAADTKDLGLLAIYQNGKTNELKQFVIPGANGDRKAWDAYIDDLKYVGEKEPGLMSTLTFVLSREMANLMSGGGGKSEDGDKKKEEYNFCFAADAPVTLPNGASKSISELASGDVVLGYNTKTKSLVPTRVTKVETHTGEFKLAGVWLASTNELTASANQALSAPILLEATANHPVLTATGRKALGDVKAGDVLYRYDAAVKGVVAYNVVRTEETVRSAKQVYNLVTESGAYLIGETIVLDK
jgi:hypothetical protein